MGKPDDDQDFYDWINIFGVFDEDYPSRYQRKKRKSLIRRLLEPTPTPPIVEDEVRKPRTEEERKKEDLWAVIVGLIIAAPFIICGFLH